MDVPTRARIVLGTLAILFALVASMALINLLILEPGTGDANTGQGGAFQPNPNSNFQPDPGEEGTGETPGEGEAEPDGKNNPCKTGRSITKSSSIVTATMAMILWIMAVWWRQHRQTKVMNGWAIAAMVFTLMAVTLFFAWYIVEKICSLRVTDFDTCKELARNLMATFIAFLVPAVGFIAFAIFRKKNGDRFLGLWSGAGFVFLYLSIMAMGGWLIASDICDQYFEPPDVDDFDPDAPDGGGETPGEDPGNPPPGSNPGTPPPGSGNQGQPGNSNQNANPGGNSAPNLVGVPQISPVALLVLMGIAAVVVIVVLALRGGGRVGFSAGSAMEEVLVVEDRSSLLALLGRKDLKSNDRVVAAYRAFLAWCTVRGVGKQPHETPHEHAARACERLDLPLVEAMNLAVAYSHTRLGNSPTPDAMRQQALEFSRSIDRRRP